MLHAAKKKFTEIVESDLARMNPVLMDAQIRLVYTLYPKTRHKQDVANVCSIVDKFFADTLVRAGILDDDTYLEIPEVIYRFGEIRKDNPGVLCEITIIENEVEETE